MMFKRRLSLLFACIALIAFFCISIEQSWANDDRVIDVYVNEEQLEFSIEPYLTEGTTLVQFRPLFEAMDIDITWNQQERSITGTQPNFHLTMNIGSEVATVNGEEIELLKAPHVIQGHTMVPIRFVSESTGALVFWNPYQPEILIYTDAFLEQHGVTREQISEAIAQLLEELRLEIEAREVENAPIEPVPVPTKPTGDGSYKPATSEEVDLQQLQGMYEGFRNDMGGYECGGICWDFYTFLPNNQMYIGAPTTGGPETIDCSEGDCYEYEIQNGTLTLSNGDTYAIEVADDGLVIDDVQLTPVKPVEDSLTLNAEYKHQGYEGYVGIGYAVTWTYTIEFRSDGTFKSTDVMLGSIHGGGEVTHGSSGDKTTGSYELSGNTLTLAYRDGTVEHVLFFIHDSDSDEIDDIQIGNNNYYY